MAISIITFNTAGILIFSRDFFIKCQKVTEIIKTKEIDVINFQEVVFYPHLLYLKKLLPQFPYISYKPSPLGPQAGLVTFSRLPLQFEEFRTFTKNGNYTDLSLIHVLARRGMLMSKLKIENIAIINTHFSANLSNKWETNNSYVQILKQQINDLYNQIDSNRKTIITGDFNIPKQTFLYKDLIRDSMFDVFSDMNKPTHLGDFFFKDIKNLQVDYMLFYSKQRNTLHIQQKKVIFDQPILVGSKVQYLSDHIGLFARMQLT